MKKFGRCKRQLGFTLIELLVVIAIIALLLSVLLPSLRLAKEHAKRVVCLAGLKSLTLCWTLYAEDNGGKMVNGMTIIDPILMPGEAPWVDNFGLPAWPATSDNLDHQEAGIMRGALWSYGENLKCYRCPEGKKYNLRTYSVVDAMNGITAVPGTYPNYIEKALPLKRGIASKRIVFIDEGYATTQTWTIFFETPQWWDPVPLQHGNGTSLGFADAHAEYRKWEDERTIDFAERAAEDINSHMWRPVQKNNIDLQKLQRGIWGTLGY